MRPLTARTIDELVVQAQQGLGPQRVVDLLLRTFVLAVVEHLARGRGVAGDRGDVRDLERAAELDLGLLVAFVDLLRGVAGGVELDELHRVLLHLARGQDLQQSRRQQHGGADATVLGHARDVRAAAGGLAVLVGQRRRLDAHLDVQTAVSLLPGLHRGEGAVVLGLLQCGHAQRLYGARTAAAHLLPGQGHGVVVDRAAELLEFGLMVGLEVGEGLVQAFDQALDLVAVALRAHLLDAPRDLFHLAHIPPPVSISLRIEAGQNHEVGWGWMGLGCAIYSRWPSIQAATSDRR
ncbi:hypothetical protein [Lysobacter enzymogenes]|uniref:hypothetical protein n=1 Tax=Lysobacter enzymogenes TaxID=69 RepID=UPI002264C7D9|nr:hypothetical protein [Lysobacter enzymogenes]UZW60274.1 hypothetical protein BV903_023870 [Lysobacter enzymogenes]